MKKRLVHVQFDGFVEVQMPDHMPDADADLLADKMAVAKILATTENPDAPEEDACDEYLHEGSVHASEQDWDESSACVVTGSWQSLGVQPAE